MAKHFYQERESNRHQSTNKLNVFHEAQDLRVLNRTTLGDHVISSEAGCSSVSPGRSSSSASGLRGVSNYSSTQLTSGLKNGSYGAPVQRNDSNLDPSSVHLGSRDRHFQSHHGESPSSFLAIKSSNSSHPFALGEIEECDKYNPLILHHAEIQSIPQHRDTRVPLNKAYPLPEHYDNLKDYAHRGATYFQEPRPHRHNLLYNQGLCQMSGKVGVLTPKATSAVSTTMSIALAHTVISPSGSSDASSTSFSTNSTAITKDSTSFKDQELQTDSQRNPCNRRTLLSELPPIDRNPSRQMSSTKTPSPKLLDTIFQRVWNPQQTLPENNPSPLTLTDEDLETFGMSDSQLVKYRTKQDWNHRRGTASSGSSIPIKYPASSSFTGSGSPCRSSSQSESGWVEGQQFRRFNESFIHQVTFNLDETHKSGLQAILALRKLTNGLTSAKIAPNSKANGSKFTSPSIPIPKISHRYPEKSRTVFINGQPRVMNNKIVPSVVIDWSDGVRDEFDPTGMSLDDILARCHYSS